MNAPFLVLATLYLACRPASAEEPASIRGQVAHLTGLSTDRGLDVAAEQHLASVLGRFETANRDAVDRLLAQQGLALARLKPFSALGASRAARIRLLLEESPRYDRSAGFTHFGLADGPRGLVALFGRRLADVGAPTLSPPGRLTVRGVSVPSARLSAWALGPCPKESPCSATPSRVPVDQRDGAFSFEVENVPAGRWTVQLTADVGLGPEVAWVARLKIDDDSVSSVPVRAAPPLATTPARWLAGLRERHDRAPLEPEPKLDAAAAGHAAAVCSAGWATHRTPGGPGPQERARAGGFLGPVAEAVALAAPLERALSNLEASPAHLAALLEPTATHVGIGVDRRDRTGCVVVLIGSQR